MRNLIQPGCEGPRTDLRHEQIRQARFSFTFILAKEKATIAREEHLLGAGLVAVVCHISAGRARPEAKRIESLYLERFT